MAPTKAEARGIIIRAVLSCPVSGRYAACGPERHGASRRRWKGRRAHERLARCGPSASMAVARKPTGSRQPCTRHAPTHHSQRLDRHCADCPHRRLPAAQPPSTVGGWGLHHTWRASEGPAGSTAPMPQALPSLPPPHLARQRGQQEAQPGAAHVKQPRLGAAHHRGEVVRRQRAPALVHVRGARAATLSASPRARERRGVNQTRGCGQCPPSPGAKVRRAAVRGR